MNTHRLLTTIATLALACSFASADTVKLKSGETYKGTITAEDATSVTIEFAVEGTKGIKDERRFEKSEIASFQKDDPADKAWAEVTKEIPTADLMTTSDYDLLTAKVEAFIGAHGKSPRGAEARRLLAALKDERAQVAAGGLKLDGVWIPAEQRQREKFWVDGRIALRQMNDLAKAGRRQEALRIFEKLEATHGGTTVHEKAITEAGSILKAYAASIGEAIQAHPLTMSQRAKVLTTLTAEERRKTEVLQQAEVNEHKARLETEKKSGTKWLTMAAFDLEELKKTAELIGKEEKRLAAINTSEAASIDATLRQIDEAFNEKRVDAAATLLGQVSSKAQSVPYIKALQDRLKTESEAAAAEKKAADEARAAAERAQRDANPSPVSPNIPEPDPIKEGMNPVAKAVAESDLGKRVAAQDNPTPPAEPAPTTGEPSTVTTPEPVAEPAPAESSPGEVEKPSSSEKPATGKGLTPILYVVAGILLLALVGLLVLPSLKKKPEEDTSVLEHHKKQPQDETDPDDPEAR